MRHCCFPGGAFCPRWFSHRTRWLTTAVLVATLEKDFTETLDAELKSVLQLEHMKLFCHQNASERKHRVARVCGDGGVEHSVEALCLAEANSGIFSTLAPMASSRQRQRLWIDRGDVDLSKDL
eukprot:TRINITY_DN63809_c0_g1_i1.p2 TRINITY_DN63809_c0_g1~~TRINITY_DN63809_c0_g1_i1.p2  ORF type:complete len:123 (+),score=17.82 TRINITY_DN63809_c0_g1_i1:287-655(+)